MGNAKFSYVAASPENKKWEAFTKRKDNLYQRPGDMRSEFTRDYNRILHCTAYRRLKHKTQVFFATENDHICTRMEHVNHVVSVSYTLCKYLGLDTELANAIAIGHDLGHAPFGHEGEKILRGIISSELKEIFWHEKNSLWFVDKIETLPNSQGEAQNLNLTYAVRDGIISHCGEVDERAIFPRDEAIDLNIISKANEYSPFTWEGCVVKISDKISYLGRDIEDAITLELLDPTKKEELIGIIKDDVGIESSEDEITNAILIHIFMVDLCDNSNPTEGIRFSEKYSKLMSSINKFNLKNIYEHPRLSYYRDYAKVVLNSIYEKLLRLYATKNILDELNKYKHLYPLLYGLFYEWLIKYSDIDLPEGKERKQYKYANEIVYRLHDKNEYIRAVIHYISGMTDNFANKTFHELTRFE